MANNIKITHSHEDFYIAYKNFADPNKSPSWVPVAKITLLPTVNVVFAKKAPLSEEEKADINKRVSTLNSVLAEKRSTK